MFTFLKKRFGASCGIRVVIALLYGLVNFTVLLSHTCFPIKEHPHSCCLEDSICKSTEESCDGTCLEIELNQNGFNSTVLSHRENCPACLYSLVSESYKLNQATPQVLCEDIVKVRFVYHLNFTKQFE